MTKLLFIYWVHLHLTGFSGRYKSFRSRPGIEELRDVFKTGQDRGGKHK